MLSSVSWGNIRPIKDIDISKYEDVSEEDDPSYVSYGYLNGLFPNTSADADTVAVDTTAVDTAAAYY